MGKGRFTDYPEEVQLADGSILRYLQAEETYVFLGIHQQYIQDMQ